MTEDRKIIRFPGTAFKMTGKTTTEPAVKLSVGPLSFHCTGCGEICHADFKKMIFRTVEFHCAGCGTLFKIANPGFAPKR